MNFSFHHVHLSSIWFNLVLRSQTVNIILVLIVPWNLNTNPQDYLFQLETLYFDSVYQDDQVLFAPFEQGDSTQSNKIRERESNYLTNFEVNFI